MTPMDEQQTPENTVDAPVPGRVPEAGAAGEDVAVRDAGPTVLHAALMVAGFLALQVVSGLVLAVLADARGEKPDVAAITLIGGGATALAMLLWVAHTVRQRGRAFREAIGFRPIGLTPGATFWAIFSLYFSVRVLSGLYAWAFLGDGVEGAAEHMADAAFTSGSALQTAALWLFVAGIGPMAEEVIFRGYLQSALRVRYGAWMAITAAAAVFATAHFVPILWPMYFLLGLSFGAAYHLTGSIKPAIALHMFNNAVALGAQMAGLGQ